MRAKKPNLVAESGVNPRVNFRTTPMMSTSVTTVIRSKISDLRQYSRKRGARLAKLLGGLTFLTRKEAVRELRISLTKLDRVIARGELRAKKHGHAVVVMQSEIARYIRQWPYVKPRTEHGAR